MIPKQLHFIWVGQVLPNWAAYAYDAYVKMNPTFNFNFIQIKEFHGGLLDSSVTYDYHTNDECLVNVPQVITNLLKNLKNEDSFIYWKYKQNTQSLKITNLNVMLSDLLRFQILNMYGGIYVDCDTFPIKPFDDKLLNRKQFFALSYYGGIKLVRDNFFLGSEEDKWIDFRYRNFRDMTYPISYKIRESSNFMKFFNCELTLDEPSYTKHGYIDHFFLRSWK